MKQTGAKKMRRQLIIIGFVIVVAGLLYAQSQGWIVGEADYEKIEEQTR